ncbi:pyridoxamine 5'-phosphate oxidase family protein [Bradyrhizobium sp. LHD-71]|uniref:pyridoxamine 5'-phosphate oxidase family protein n=1 Tax=Bradyrhizobium sp. LHD-71 TaxID=3072141 RepID=UPI00280EAE43|nr:pyridoxamine 5'-phosphate oxidase family protein [Bradyrhizobium sp. LHD-71]MDQ8732761.1 pyridoxamine 5'-phosphate oxidase family protein [Bradyrhizobium sp. LHD-71]
MKATQTATDELKTNRVRLRRRPTRGHYDYETVASILDATFLCHIGFTVDDQPFVIPTSFGRDGRRLYVHGSAASRMLKQLKTSIPLCLTVTLLDGLVLARSAFNHSMNYRSVVVLGSASLVEGDEKLTALKIMSEHILKGRWDDVRLPNAKEMKATSVLALDIEEASAKIRSGPPLDDDEDLDFPCWAGVLPIVQTTGQPVPDPGSRSETPLPDYLMPPKG